MAVNVYGVLGIALFYVVILVIGLLAARKRSQQPDTEGGSTTEEVMLAGRSIGTFVGTFTMTGTKRMAQKAFHSKNRNSLPYFTLCHSLLRM